MVKKVISLLIILIIVSIFTITAYAEENIAGFDVNISTSNYRYQDNIITIEDISFSKSNSVNIEFFDVSKNGCIALAISENPILPVSEYKKYIVVIDDDGKIISAMKFIESGAFYVLWDDESLLIYSVRGCCLLQTNVKGELQNVYDVLNTSHNDRIVRNFDKRVTYTSQSGDVYTLRKPQNKKYCVLIKQYENKESVIFNVNDYILNRPSPSASKLPAILCIILSLLLMLIIINFVINKFVFKTKRSKNK